MSYNTAKAEATHDANILLRKLLGKGWKVHIWKNPCWHYSVDNAQYGLSICESVGGYFAMVSPSYAHLYDGHKTFRDPNRAVTNLLKSIKASADEHVAIHTKAMGYLIDIAADAKRDMRLAEQAIASLGTS
jgi:hypothetical protein